MNDDDSDAETDEKNMNLSFDMILKKHPYVKINENDDEDEDDQLQFIELFEDLSNEELKYNTTIAEVLVEIREVVKLFKRSPVMNGHLQKNFKENIGHKFQLKIDKTC